MLKYEFNKYIYIYVRINIYIYIIAFVIASLRSLKYVSYSIAIKIRQKFARKDNINKQVIVIFVLCTK